MTPVPVPRILVFVGPSFPATRICEFVPSAEVRPPIRRGDLEEIAAPAIVAIIDGATGGEDAVSPREIRIAIARGVRIVGSSGTGALRAAEVPEMIGVGRIYEMYRSGLLQRDDEVAVLLGTDGVNAVTEPLVNVRFAVDTLVRAGTIAEQTGASIIEAASALHFHDRTYRNILQKADLSRLGDADDLVRILQSIDLRTDDAQTLLERLVELGSDTRWSLPYVTGESDAHDSRDFDPVPNTAAADAPLLVWEFGERIQWHELFDFLAITGKLNAHARRVLARTAIDVLPHVELADPADVPSVQDLFSATMLEWGWEGTEEVHVTLKDLGVGFEDLQGQLRNERTTRKKLRALTASRDDGFMRALRLDLVISDLALKREAMRLGALQALAQGGAADLTETEVDDAKRALLCERPELTWEGLLNDAGMREADARRVVILVASARRVGSALLDAIEGAPEAEGSISAAATSLPLATRAPGSRSHSIANDTAAVMARRVGDVIGVTRVALVGEFERFGLHVASAYRPSKWSSTVGSGKGETVEEAVVGALMEELEKYCQEQFAPDVLAEGSFRELESDRAIDPQHCALPYDSSYKPEESIAWSWMSDLAADRRFLVPTALLSVRRGRNDVLFSPRKGGRAFYSSGLASGFTVTEALVHALCERIERHAMKLAEQAVSNPGHLDGSSRWPFAFIKLQSCPKSTQFIISCIHRAGYEARVMDITCEVGVPTFSARIFRPGRIHGLEGEYAAGACTHPNSEVAINRAVLEAVQTCIGSLSGAREDLGIRARSLGRHERPRPLSRGDGYWIRPHVPKKPLSRVSGLLGQNARDDLEFIVRRLTAAGFDRVLYRDLSRDEVAPACVVRAFVPGMEDTNPFHTGLRARTLMVQDLMRHHEW